MNKTVSKKYLSIFLLPIVVGVSVILFSSISRANINQEINFNGKIVNIGDGSNIKEGFPACVKTNQDTCDFKTSIYNTSTGTTPLWSEVFTDIELGSTNGIFSLSIGSYCITNQGGSWTSDGDGEDIRCEVNDGGVIWGEDPSLFIEIQFDTEDTVGTNSFNYPETFTRRLLTSVPSAFTATYAENEFINLKNNSGLTLEKGSLVILDTTQDQSFTITNQENNIRALGVLISDTCDDGNNCLIQTSGTVEVKALSGITRGQYIYTSQTSTFAKGSDSATDDGFVGTAITNELGGKVTIILASSSKESGAVNEDFYIKFRPDTPQNTGETANPLIYLNENGSSSPNLIQIQAGGLDKFIVDNTGDLTIAGGDITGSNGISLDLGEINTSGITVTGDLLPATTNTYDLGSSNLRWKDGYFGGKLSIGAGSLILTDDYIRDADGDLVLRAQQNVVFQAGDNPNDTIYIAQTNQDGATSPGLFWSGIDGYTNNPGIRVNPITGQLEYRDQNSQTWIPFDSLAGGQTPDISNEVPGETTIGSEEDQVDLTEYGDIITGGSTEANEDLTAGDATNSALFVYNTFNDSDTGAWRNSNASKASSWYSENIDDKETSSDTCVIFSDDRCGKADFPSIVSIIATDQNLFIYDAGLNKLWMKFELNPQYVIENNSINDITAKDGVIFLATNTGIVSIDFKTDTIYKYNNEGRMISSNNIAARNSGNSYSLELEDLKIPSNTINSLEIVNQDSSNYLAAGTSAGAILINTNPTIVNGQISGTNIIQIGSTSAFKYVQSNDNIPSVKNLVDHSLNTSYISNINNPEITIKLDQISVVNQYAITGYSESTGISSSLNSWILEGSTDGFTWTELDNQSGHTFTNQYERKSFNFLNTVAYEYYRIRVTQNNGNTSSTTINEIEIGGPKITASSESAGITNRVQNVIFQDSNNTNQIWTANADSNQWIGFDYGSQGGVSINSYIVKASTSGVPLSWELQGSNAANPGVEKNNVDWTTLDTITDSGLSPNQYKSYSFDNTANFRHYRIYLNNSSGGNLSIENLVLNQESLVMYGGDSDLNMYDNNISTFSTSINSITSADTSYVDLERSFGSGISKNLVGIDINYPEIASSARNLIVLGSNDRNNWVEIDNIDDSISNSLERTYRINNNENYTYYRIRFNSVRVENQPLKIGEIKFLFGEQIDQFVVDTNQRAYIASPDRMGIEVFENIFNMGELVSNSSKVNSIENSNNSINQLPRFGETNLKFVAGRLLYSNRFGIEEYEYTNENILEKINTISTEFIGDYSYLFEFDNLELSTEITEISNKSRTSNLNSGITATPTYEEGIVGLSAAKFNAGSDEFISISDADFSTNISDRFTFGTWINISPESVGNRMIAGTYNSIGDGWYVKINEEDKVTISDGTHEYTTESAINKDEWTSIVIVFDSKTLKVYINGIESLTTELENTITDGGDFHIANGGSGVLSGQTFDGLIDDLFISNSVMNSQEISSVLERSIDIYTKGVQISAGTAGTVNISGAGFNFNEFSNKVIEIVSGTGVGQTRIVKSNSTSQINIGPDWDITPDGTSFVKVYGISMPGINQVSDVNIMNGKYLISQNSGDAQGGFVMFDNDKNKFELNNLSYYHGDSSTFDTGTGKWLDTYDNVIEAYVVNEKLHLISDNHYWIESNARTLTEQINEVESGTIEITPSTRNESLSDQAVVIGFSYIKPQLAGSSSASEKITYGRTFLNTPTIVGTISGAINRTEAPNSSSECSESANLNVGFNSVTNKSAQLNIENIIDDSTLNENYYYCINWIAFGEASDSGADLAENYLTYDLDVEAGDVIAIDYENDISIVRTKEAYDRGAIGIVATQPSIIIGPADGTTPGVQSSITGNEVVSGEGKVVPIALSGRVPVKVSLENGPIKRGDFLTPASIPGYAMKATEPGITIGRALEDFDGTRTIIDTDKDLSEIDKLIELGDIDLNFEPKVKEETSSGTNLLFPEVTNVEVDSAITSFGASKLDSFNGETGKVMAFVQTGYYWGDTNDNTVVDNNEEVLDNVENQTVETTEENVNIDEESTQEVNLDETVDINIENIIVPQENGSQIGSFTLGRLILREESNSINSVGDKLRFQTISDEPIEFYGGSILFDKFGNIITLGSIRADSIFVNQIFVDKATGETSVEAGQKEIYIENSFISEDSTIFITSDQFINYRIKNIDPGRGFAIEFIEETKTIIRIKYLFIN